MRAVPPVPEGNWKYSCGWWKFSCFPTLCTCTGCWKSRCKTSNGNFRHWQSRNDSALSVPVVLFVFLIFIPIERGGIAISFPLSFSELDGPPQKCVCERGSLVLGQKGNCKIYVVSPCNNRKQWKQVPKNAHRHLMKLFNDFKIHLR